MAKKKRKLKSIEKLEELGFVHGSDRKMTHKYCDPDLMYITANDMAKHDMQKNGVVDIPNWALKTKAKKGTSIIVKDDDGKEVTSVRNYATVVGAKWITNKTTGQEPEYEKERVISEKTGRARMMPVMVDKKDENGNQLFDEKGKPLKEKKIAGYKTVEIVEGDNLTATEYSELMLASINCYVNPKSEEIHCKNERMLAWIQANAFE